MPNMLASIQKIRVLRSTMFLHLPPTRTGNWIVQRQDVALQNSNVRQYSNTGILQIRLRVLVCPPRQRVAFSAFEFLKHSTFLKVVQWTRL
uniref:Uncharacterized protein n=1 Tax=Globodera rostochiensis TaxID=31243 RepID=A0A914IAA1_GLORO